jgi:hypothetical protein
MLEMRDSSQKRKRCAAVLLLTRRRLHPWLRCVSSAQWTRWTQSRLTWARKQPTCRASNNHHPHPLHHTPLQVSKSLGTAEESLPCLARWGRQAVCAGRVPHGCSRVKEWEPSLMTPGSLVHHAPDLEARVKRMGHRRSRDKKLKPHRLLCRKVFVQAVNLEQTMAMASSSVLNPADDRFRRGGGSSEHSLA